MDYKEEILKLKVGERFTIPESDYGKAEIYRHSENVICLFSIPLFGGDPVFEKDYQTNEVDRLISDVALWD